MSVAKYEIIHVVTVAWEEEDFWDDSNTYNEEDANSVKNLAPVEVLEAAQDMGLIPKHVGIDEVIVRRVG